MLSLSQCVQLAVSSVPSYLCLALAACKVTHQCTLLALFVLGSVLLLFQVIDVQSKHLDLSPDISRYLCLQCFDAVGWAAGRASGL